MGPDAKKLWKEAKAAYKKLKKPNYIVQEVEHTWSAFTFNQLHSQKFSFAAAKATAVAVLEGVKRARKRAGLVVGPVAAVW